MNESLIIGEIIGDLIIGEIVDLPKKFYKEREASIISGPQLNIIASILENILWGNDSSIVNEVIREIISLLFSL